MPDNAPLVIKSAIKLAVTEDDRWHPVAHSMSPDHRERRCHSLAVCRPPKLPVSVVALGDGIRRARSEREMSQGALTDTAGIDCSYMGKIARGERNVTILNVTRVATALGLTVAALT